MSRTLRTKQICVETVNVSWTAPRSRTLTEGCRLGVLLGSQYKKRRIDLTGCRFAGDGKASVCCCLALLVELTGPYKLLIRQLFWWIRCQTAYLYTVHERVSVTVCSIFKSMSFYSNSNWSFTIVSSYFFLNFDIPIILVVSTISTPFSYLFYYLVHLYISCTVAVSFSKHVSSHLLFFVL